MRFLLPIVVLTLLAPFVGAQDETVLRDLRALHARISAPDKVLSPIEAREAAENLAVWRLQLDAISSEARALALGVQVYAALGAGDAARAAEALAPLLKEFPDDKASLEAAYLVACANADAEIGLATLDKLGKLTRGPEKQRVMARSRWMRGVGEFAPEVTIRTEDVRDLPVAKRGDYVLVIDFWNSLATPNPEHVAGLKALYEEADKSGHGEFVGVNSDAESRQEAAKGLAADVPWPQRYELVSTKAPITHEAFNAGRPPWVVVVDTLSYVRAVGAGNEPGLAYALRAALAEARGDFKPIKPRTREGRQAAATPEVVRKADTSSGGERVSNAEAASKLRQARLYLKTGKKTDAMRLLEEIVRDYPNTVEAEEAKQYLDP